MPGLDEFVAPRRKPAVEKNISEITKDDIRVRITGMVLDKKDNIAIIDDGTGRITVMFAEPIEVDTNQMVRVIGRVIPTESGFEIEGEILQNIDNVDINIYKKIRDLEKNLGI
ncbi:MAG: replication protein RepA [Candidatus Aenigmarchaeota archaeon]|nr:replication protein RepA [Candidatus Aenigmarchaeota archaeon]